MSDSGPRQAEGSQVPVGGVDHDPSVILTELPNDPQQPSEAAHAGREDPQPFAESHLGDERRQESDGDRGEPAPFPEERRQGFMALLHIGRLSKTFWWLGNEIVIRTLLDGELLDVGLIHKKYAGTLGDIKAYQTAIVAGCIVTVNGEVPPIPLDMSPPKGNSDVDPALLLRFNHIAKHWYPPTIDAIYEQYLLLEKEVTETLEAMGNQ